MVDIDWSDLSEPQRVAHLIREIGPSRLANFDGCICSRFSIRNVDFTLSCGSGSPRGIIVGSGSMDYMEASDYREIVDALSQIEFDHRGPIEIRVVHEGEIFQSVEIQTAQ